MVRLARKSSILRLLLNAFALCMAPTLVVFVVLAQREYSRDVDSVEQDGARAISSLMAIQSRIALNANVLLRTLSSTDDFKQLNAQEMAASFRNILKFYPDYANLHAVYPNGEVFASAAPIPEGGVNLLDRKHVLDALATKDFAVGEYIVSRVAFEPVLPFSFPVTNDRGDILAVLVAVLRLSSLSEGFEESMSVDKSSVILLDHSFRVLLRYPGSVSQVAYGAVDEELVNALKNGSGQALLTDGDGIERVYTVRPVVSGGRSNPYMYIAVGIPMATARARGMSTLVFWTVLTSGVMLVSLVASWLLIRKKIAGNCREIVKASQGIMEGQLDARTGLTDSDGELGVVGVAFDEMAGKLQAGILDLRESEERFRALVEQAPEAIVVIDVQDGSVVLVNEKAQALFGCGEKDLLSGGIFRFYLDPQPNDMPAKELIKDTMRRALAGETVLGERVIRNALGEFLTCEIRAVRFPARDRSMVRSSWIDITQRKKIEEALRVSEDQFRSVVGTLPIGMLFFDVAADGRLAFLSANPAATRQFELGKAGLAGKTVEEAFPSLAALGIHDVVRAIMSGETPTFTSRSTLEDDTLRGIFDIYMFMPKDNRLAVALLDITEKMRMQDVMVQTEKMMSVGGLAAGMAHEINNPLSAIMQSAQVLQRRLLQDNAINHAKAQEAGCTFESISNFLQARDVPSMLAGILESGVRAARVVSGMLEFSRRVESNRSYVQLGSLLDKAVELSSNDYDLKKKYDFRHIRIVREYDETLGSVQCTGTQIEQVFLNLLKNAAQAMSSARNNGEPPVIWLRTRQESGYAVVEIEDNGPGMDEAVSRHIFDPFFTTKPSGVGTGLGLSVSRFLIAEKHNGSIAVESKPGSGTKFVIRLPLGPASSTAS
ncbi:MAG: sensor histidine [Desulfovibrionaceae bacterium]|nr:MAG: sensor histidine [Desulfovibrionaceae bacterium]